MADKFDHILPKWQPLPNVQKTSEGESVAVYRHRAPGTRGPRKLQRTSKEGRVEMVTVPAVKYMRAVHPNGHLVPVGVSSAHAESNDPQYQIYITTTKTQAGFLFVDSPPGGIALAKWQDQCLKQMDERLAAHAERERLASRAHRSMAESLAEANSTSVHEVADKLVGAITEVMASRSPK